MSDKRKRLIINLTPTPAELWAEEKRAQAVRQGHIDRLISDLKDG